jgi:tetrahydromethanopterin S-methyltransferase subunit G
MDEMDIEHRLTEVEQRSKSNLKRLDKLEESTEAINRMAISIEKMAMKQDDMNGSINKLTNDVEVLKSEPAKRWKFVVEKAIYILVAAVVGFFLAKVGLG